MTLTLHYSGSGTEESIHRILYSSKNCSGLVSGTYSYNAIDSCYSISEVSGPLASIYGYSFESCYYVPDSPTATPTVSGTRPLLPLTYQYTLLYTATTIALVVVLFHQLELRLFSILVSRVLHRVTTPSPPCHSQRGCLLLLFTQQAPALAFLSIQLLHRLDVTVVYTMGELYNFLLKSLAWLH
jgi:hypothetical protein